MCTNDKINNTYKAYIQLILSNKLLTNGLELIMYVEKHL